MKRINEEHSIGDVLKTIIKQNKLNSGLDKIDVKQAWITLMGNGVAAYTEAIELKKETLYVKLSSSVLREELMYGREKIVKMINEELGKEIIKKIVLV